MKISSVAKYIKNLFGIKDEKSNMSDEEIIKLNYFECICYLYKGKEKPIVTGFRDDVNIWLETTVGPIELDSIPHNNAHLTNCVYELEALIGENDFSTDYVIEMINSILNDKWDRN